MSFINLDSGICLSNSGEVVYPACDSIDLIKEQESKYILSESIEKLMIDGPACGVPIPQFDCNFDRKVVESGKYITLTNVCNMPITVTGFTVSDPIRFSLFDYPNNVEKEIYTSENTEHLPFTIYPNEYQIINTYFHPLEEELTYGNSATYDDRTGDAFSARVDVYPGFPIANCDSDQNGCDAFFILSGEFVCQKPEKDWMYNNENFITPNLAEIPQATSDTCLSHTDPINFEKPGGLQVQNTFLGLRDTSVTYQKILNQNGTVVEKYNDIGMMGSLAGFEEICNERIDSGQDNLIDKLFKTTLVDYSYIYNDGSTNYEMTVNYSYNNIVEAQFENENYTGMIFDVVPTDLSMPFFYNVVFIKVDPKDSDIQINKMFVSVNGDFQGKEFC